MTKIYDLLNIYFNSDLYTEQEKNITNEFKNKLKEKINNELKNNISYESKNTHKSKNHVEFWLDLKNKKINDINKFINCFYVITILSNNFIIFNHEMDTRFYLSPDIFNISLYLDEYDDIDDIDKIIRIDTTIENCLGAYTDYDKNGEYLEIGGINLLFAFKSPDNKYTNLDYLFYTFYQLLLEIKYTGIIKLSDKSRTYINNEAIGLLTFRILTDNKYMSIYSKYGFEKNLNEEYQKKIGDNMKKISIKFRKNY